MTLRPSVLVLAIFFSAPMAAQQPTFSSRLEVVRLDALVTDNGQPVRGLTAADFEVLDNGVRQTLDLVSFEQIPLSVVLAADVSESLSGDRLQHLRDAGHGLLDALRKGDQAALVTFSEVVAQAASLTSNIAQVRKAVDALEPTGETSLIDGTFAGITVAETGAGRGLLMIFSDGRDTASWLTDRAVIEAGRRSEVVVYAVSSGAKNPEFLEDLTEATGGRLYQIESTRDLRRSFVDALNEFRQRYLISYTPQGVPGRGWHRLEVRVKGRRGTVRARPGYFAGS
jgi:Ca-activated chloride channel homolog